ncbi:DUF6493 family protein [Streptomyces sp. VRA16 Mangrove soil]|uniref:DUF7824 domain-containing protein n=1 Tax=Streptomyces sp. VRA16 Mangrove soil TaxID=2817434 RepID=UPI001A9ED73A|nr:DUF6493 family protein [Streptomyces sp. VRA16 Mangrove soil]MBO1332533.1 hypothetical protein [Streptomyces sp. VRA16 Mangrove soil]
MSDGTTLVQWVRKGDPDQVAQLLGGMTDAERRACVPALKDLRKELRVEPWGRPARAAYPALRVAGAACHTGAAAAAAWIGAADWRWSGQAVPELLRVLGDREKEWQADVAHRLAALPLSRGVSFEVVSGLVALSGCPVPTTEAYVVGWVDHVNGEVRGRRSLADRLRAEPHLAALTAALFETDDIGGRLDWFEADSPVSWSHGLATLTAEGVLERKVVVDGCVARLVRGGRPSDLRLFLKVLDRLALSRDEERERLADWAALCADGAGPVAGYAQKVLGALALDGDVPVRSLAEVSVAVLFRPEKKLVRAQLVLLDKVLRKGTPQGAAPVADEVLPAVGEAFGHADTEVQERALKVVARHLAGAGSAAREQLVLAAQQLSAGPRSRAEEVLGVRLAVDGPYQEVLPPAAEPFRLCPAPDSAAEVAEEVGALLSSGGDTAALERTLDGLMRHAYRDRAALKEALQPVVARRWWYGTDRPDHTQTYFRDATHGLEVVAATVVESVRTDVLHRAVTHGAHESRSPADGTLRRCHDARLWEAAYRIRTEPVPFLLATPTWSTGFIEPAELVARLAAYRAAKVRAGEADFAQALLRVDRGDGLTARAARDAAALGTPEGERLAEWLRSPAPAQPVVTLGDESGHLLVGMGEQADLQSALPDPFRRLGRPLSLPDAWGPYWYFEADTVQQRSHYLSMLPGRRESVAARLLRELSHCAVHDVRGAAGYLPLLAEAEGPAGQAVHLSVAYGLAARHPEDRLAAVDALLILAGRRQLDAPLLGSLLARGWEAADVKATRLADAFGTAAGTGAFTTVSAVLRGLLPTLLASKESPVALRGLADLLALAADCAERTGERGTIPGLAEVAARKGSSRLVAQARRLHTAIG